VARRRRTNSAPTEQAGPRPVIPLLDHALDDATVFSPAELVEAVRLQRGRDRAEIPPVCVLEFDGDLTDELIRRGEVERCDAWPCFHTEMWVWRGEGLSCGIVGRTIGGPYAVLVAEQMAVCGARAIVGLASAGRVAPSLPIPSVVVADSAIRDEGTSFHYLPPGPVVHAPGPLPRALEVAIRQAGLEVCRGLVWTTDAPYRETAAQIRKHADSGALAVEMQAASLFAFAVRSGIQVGLVAQVSNAPDHDGRPFDKGHPEADRLLLRNICEAAARSIEECEGVRQA
jgi:uridine phosphorylase